MLQSEDSLKTKLPSVHLCDKPFNIGGKPVIEFEGRHHNKWTNWSRRGSSNIKKKKN